MPDPTGRISHLPEMHRGVAWKEPVRVATSSNVAPTGISAGNAIDGVTLVSGDRVLAKNQTAASSNGIYRAGAAGTWPARAYDMDQDASSSVPATEVVGAVVQVVAGGSNGGTFWRTTNTTAPTIGTTAINWLQAFTGGGGSSGVTDHGALTGLSDDDHTQYTLRAYGGKETVQSHGAAGATETIDLANGNSHAVTLDANCTFTFTGATNGTECSFLLELTEDSTGGWTPTWPGSVIWAGGSAPTHTTTANTTTLYVFRSRDGGTNWYGSQVGGPPATVSAGSNSMAVAGLSAAGVSSNFSPADHRHEGVWAITSSSSNTLSRPVVNLRPGANVAFGLTDTDGNGVFDTISISATATGGGGGGGLTQAYIGYNTIGGSWETATSLRVYAKKVTVSNDCLITSIGAYVRNNSAGADDQVEGVQVGLYTDASGSPALLIGMGGQQGSTVLFDSASGATGDGVARWFELPIGLWVTAGDYWLAVQPTNITILQIAYDGSGSDRYYTAGGEWMNDWGFYTPTTSSRTYSIRANTIR
jgi:hypothetical protein